MAMYTKCPRCFKKIPTGTLCKCNKERHKEYDKRIRNQLDNKKYADFYNSSAWQRMRDYITIKYSGLCLMCLIENSSITPNDVVHHIEELRENFDKRLAEDNLITLCHGCHNTLHGNYGYEQKVKLRELLETFKKIYM